MWRYCIIRCCCLYCLIVLADSPFNSQLVINNCTASTVFIVMPPFFCLIPKPGFALRTHTGFILFTGPAMPTTLTIKNFYYHAWNLTSWVNFCQGVTQFSYSVKGVAPQACNLPTGPPSWKNTWVPVRWSPP